MHWISIQVMVFFQDLNKLCKTYLPRAKNNILVDLREQLIQRQVQVNIVTLTILSEIASNSLRLLRSETIRLKLAQASVNQLSTSVKQHNHNACNHTTSHRALPFQPSDYLPLPLICNLDC